MSGLKVGGTKSTLVHMRISKLFSPIPSVLDQLVVGESTADTNILPALWYCLLRLSFHHTVIFEMSQK